MGTPLSDPDRSILPLHTCRGVTAGVKAHHLPEQISPSPSALADPGEVTINGSCSLGGDVKVLQLIGPHVTTWLLAEKSWRTQNSAIAPPPTINSDLQGCRG